MLYPLPDVEAALASLGEPKPIDYTFRHFCLRPGVRLFGDSADQPAAILALRGADMMLFATSDAARRAAMECLLKHQFAEEAWPDEPTRKAWERSGQPFVFVNSSSLQVVEDGLAAGFVVPPEYKPGVPANLYWWQGHPRLSAEVRHSCRLGRGMELWQHLREGIGYDEEGEYVRAILSEKPSFVCEVNGEPVSWSTIHLNGAMGMIYTLPQHRRQGYARSLAAFQIDHQLRAHGFACCHVVGDNVPSYTMLLGLGATKEPTPIVWRSLNWPR
jgi:GNAT superfamily N-acetyltransferase